MSTFFEIQQEVLGYGFSSPRYLTSIGNWINEAQRYIAKNSLLRTQQNQYVFNTVVGTTSYTLPTDFARIIDIHYVPDSDVFEEMTMIDRDSIDVSTTGRPNSFVIVGNVIALYPTPDAIYQIQMRYSQLPPTLVNPTDVPQIPSEYHYLLETYALYKAYRRQNDYSAAQFHRAEFDRDFAIMKNEVKEAVTSRASQMPGTWSNVAR